MGEQLTDDGHFIVISGRRWRATDPAIPEDHRAGVHAAKVALGERGSPPWWEQTDEQRRDRYQADLAPPEDD